MRDPTVMRTFRNCSHLLASICESEISGYISPRFRAPQIALETTAWLDMMHEVFVNRVVTTRNPTMSEEKPIL